MAKKATRKAAPKKIINPPKDTSYDPVFTSEEAADYLGYSYAAFRKMRTEEEGPIHILFGKKNKRYQLSDLNAWKAERREKTIKARQKIDMVRKAVHFTVVMSRTIKYHVQHSSALAIARSKNVKIGISLIGALIVLIGLNFNRIEHFLDTIK